MKYLLAFLVAFICCTDSVVDVTDIEHEIDALLVGVWDHATTGKDETYIFETNGDYTRMLGPDVTEDGTFYCEFGEIFFVEEEKKVFYAVWDDVLRITVFNISGINDKFTDNNYRKQ